MKSILLVDDADDARDAYACLLEWEGYRVLTAWNGLEAFELAREHRPDLIVMDLRMPVLDGWETARLLRSDPSTAGIPVIAVSASVLEEAHALRDELGFVAVWPKPLDPARLLEEVRGCIGTVQAVA